MFHLEVEMAPVATQTDDLMGLLQQDGFYMVPEVIDAADVARLADELAEVAAASYPRRGDAVFGIRNLLRLSSAVRELAHSHAVRRLITPVLGVAAFPVRGIFFDKTPGANWKVPWHQDLAIAVRERRDVPGFMGWSMKEGVPHVQPPTEILERMLTLRLHLDPCGPDDGPLLVLPGSHARGRLDPSEVERWRRDAAPVECHVRAGGAVVIRPLLLHASHQAARPSRRRVVHLEYAAEALPGGLEWWDR